MTEPLARPVPFRGRVMAAAAALLFMAAALCPPTMAQALEEEDIAASLAQYRAVLEEAKGFLDDLEFASAIEAYTRFIEAYRSGQIPMVTSEARDLVTQAWEGRALALANLGRNDEARADFEELIRFNPAHSIDLEGISPKIIALFTDVKKELVGVLQVETTPLGAEVSLDGQLLGPSPVMDHGVLAGDYTLRIQREGFEIVEEEITVEAGGRLERQITLVPNARGIRVATVPVDVKVLVDGEERGVTFGRADSTYEPVAAEMGLELENISEPLLIPNLAPGDHLVVLQKDCFEEVAVKVSITVDPNGNEPVAYKPFVLDPSRGSLKIQSSPQDAQVWLDGSLKGRSPLTLEDLCSGPHDIKMESEGLGRYSGTVEVRKDQTVEVSRPLRLSLAAFDLRPDSEPGRDLAAGLEGLERYNLVHPGSGAPAELGQRLRLELESTKGRGLGAATLEGAFETLGVELIGLALGAGPLGDRTEFQLYGPLHDEPDRWRLEGVGVEAFQRVKAALDRELEMYAPWSGVKLIDVKGEEHPVILTLTPGSPAATAGIEAMDFLVSAGGAPISRAADFLGALAKSSPGSELVLSLKGAEASREVAVVLRSTPVLLAPRNDQILYNKAIVDLRQKAAMAGDDTTAAGYAWLNVGMALMHFERYEEAIRSGFRKADLPDAAGISLGTVRYLTGLCYERLGLRQEAVEAFREAAASPTSTLGSHDGPTIAASAKRRIAALGGS